MTVKTDTLVRTIVAAIVAVIIAVRALLQIFGIDFPFDETVTTEALMALVTIIVMVWSWWKNNSFTQEAIQADEFMAELKSTTDSGEPPS